MPRGRPAKAKIRPQNGTGEKTNDTGEQTKISEPRERKSRGRPRHPRPEVLPAENNPGDANEVPAVEDHVESDLEDGGKIVNGGKRGKSKKQFSEINQESAKRKGAAEKDDLKSELACKLCDKTFKFRATLKQHEQIHFGIKEFECEHCHRRFLHKGTLKVHLRMHTGEMPYKCPHCPKRFRGQTALDCHVFRHTKQGTKCPQCSSVFATPSVVKQHIREVHTTERSHTCQICGVTYKHRKSLHLHLRNHQKRICPDCGKVFHSIYAMMTHRKIHAQDHFQFKCSYCDRKFEKDDELQSHNKLRGRAYQCEMCCHSFNKLDYLTNHNRRNHWKEMGLDQLKVAAPKNGWNRKGVPKPKKNSTKTDDVSEANLENEQIPIAELNPTLEQSHPSTVQISYLDPNVDSANETIIQTIVVTEQLPTEIGQNYEIIHYETHAYQPKGVVVKTITTEIEPILPRENDYAVISKVETLDDESIHDYDDETHREDDYRDESYQEPDAEETVAQNSDESKVKLEEETMEFKVEVLEPEDEDEDLGADDIVDVKQEQGTTFTSDSDDEVPLSVLLPKIQPSETQKLIDENVDASTNVKENLQEDFKDEFNDTTCRTESQQETSDDEQEASKRRRPNAKLRKVPKREMFCPFCGKSVKGRAALKQHKAAEHSDMKGKKGPFICELCGKSYATAASMVVHRGSHEKYQRYKCDECPKAFTYRCYLENHKRAEHLRERLICPLCGKLFKYSQDLKVHTRQHEDNKPFKCDLCPSVFRFPSALRCHKALHVETVFKCDICQKEFKYANSLRVHKRLHTGLKRFQCEICNREFNTKAPLVRHLATHSVEREMSCVACSKIFYKKIELVIHQTKEHPNHPLIGKTVKIHRCSVCGQEFTKKSNLTSHAYIHGDVYKYRCELCEDQKFKQHAGLRHHLIHFHKLEIRKRQPKPEKAAETVRSGPDAELTTWLVDTSVSTTAVRESQTT